MHLAELNIANTKFPTDDRHFADFMDYILDPRHLPMAKSRMTIR